MLLLYTIVFAICADEVLAVALCISLSGCAKPIGGEPVVEIGGAEIIVGKSTPQELIDAGFDTTYSAGKLLDGMTLALV